MLNGFFIEICYFTGFYLSRGLGFNTENYEEVVIYGARAITFELLLIVILNACLIWYVANYLANTWRWNKL